jgi:heptosyltransferase-2
MPDPVGRIVVYSPNWLGDAVMALPAIADIRRHFKDATLAVAAREGIDRLFQAVQGVDEVIPLCAAHAPGRSRAGEFARVFEAGRFDVAILLPNSYFSASVVALAGIPGRWGYRAGWRGRLLTRAVRRPRGRLHQAAYYRHLTTGLGVPAEPATPVVRVPPEDRRAGDALLAAHGIPPDGRFVAMAPGASNGAAKQWPPSRFAELVGLLAARSPVTVVIIGTRGDRDAADAIARAVGSAARGARLVDLVGHTSLAELMQVLARCDLLVTNDSGSMHLAAALGRRVVAIFGATDERVTAPIEWDGTRVGHAVVTGQAWCRPCLLHQCPIDHRCMTSITAAAVASRIDAGTAASPERVA